MSTLSVPISQIGTSNQGHEVPLVYNISVLQMNSQLLLWSWKVAECSLVDNLIAKKLILPTFRPDAPVLLRAKVKLSRGTSQFIGSS